MSRPWMPLYVADYRNDTVHLSAAEHGAYLLLIMHYWSAGVLPDDDRQLARITAMTAAEWRRARPVVQAFFQDGWRHKRIEEEIAKAELKHLRRQEAGKHGGIAKANAKQNPSNASGNAPSNALASSSQPQSERKKDSEPNGSDAGASRDIRADLFGKGLKSLATMTGKTPDSCRSLVGKWLKSVNDEAIHVLGAIEDAERNRVVDPVAWINRALNPQMGNHNGKLTVHDAAKAQLDKLRALDEGSLDLRDGTGAGSVRLLPPR